MCTRIHIAEIIFYDGEKICLFFILTDNYNFNNVCHNPYYLDFHSEYIFEVSIICAKELSKHIFNIVFSLLILKFYFIFEIKVIEMLL